MLYFFENYNSKKFVLDDEDLFVPKFIRDKLHHFSYKRSMQKMYIL